MKPILIFPKPTVALRIKKRRPFPQPKTPGSARQGVRLKSSFESLERGFSTASLSGDPAGFSPERTLVLETIGAVTDFYKAASKIQGLDFVQEILGDVVEPDDDFYIEKDGERDVEPLKGYAYLTMSNQAALNKLLTYWSKYTTKKHYKFPRGLAPLKYLFQKLHTIRYWNTEDRLRETGLLEDWDARLAEGQDSVPVEIELWYRANDSARISGEERVTRLIQKLDGAIHQKCVINEIQYHALLANIPASSIAQLVNDNSDDIELLRCDEVMFFRPSGQCMAPIFTSESDEPVEQEEISISDDLSDLTNEPTVALLDGLPLENHTWIRDLITIDDPDEWSEDYTPSDQKHGTSMASLIIRGDMQGENAPIPRKLYCRPILKPSPAGFDGQTRERIPEDVLPIDIIHRAVRRIFESTDDQPAAAPSVKIINLSIADPSRLFDQTISPWAKLIDYLAAKYQIIFVVSSGNHTYNIELEMTNIEFEALDVNDKERVILQGIANDTHLRRLMSPAESINSLTVAASHYDEYSGDEFYKHINPYIDRTMPSTINPVTWGKKRSVKPEILMPGGRATYRLKSVLDNDPAILEILTFDTPPGQMVASPGTAGSVTSYSHTFGTSNSAALASRRLCFLNETIQDLYLSQHGVELSREYENVLLKSLLCHGASHSQSFERIEEVLKDTKNSKRFKSIAAKYLGFGNVNEERIHGCLDNQATILQCGKIKQDDTHTYKFTLPDSLNAQATNRRLIITLSWLSPINPNSHQYRQAHLLFEPPAADSTDNHLDLQSRELDWQMVRNGTVQHEVLSGSRATAYASGTDFKINIACKGQAGAKNIAIPYGLVVTLETPDIDLPIYEEVKAGIEVQFNSQVQAAPPIKQ